MRQFLSLPDGRVKSIAPGDPVNRLEEVFGGLREERLSPEAAWAVQGWYRRCVMHRMDALGGIPYTLSRSGSVFYDSAAEGPMPSEYGYLRDFETLLAKVEAAMMLTGRAYVRPVVQGGRTTELEWLNPLTVKEEYGSRGQIVRYRRDVRDPSTGMVSQRYYPADQVVAFYEPDPFVEIGPGSSEGIAARVAADILQSLDQFLDGYMDRGLLPAAIFSVPSTTSPQERSQFQAWVDRFYRGKRNAGQARVVNADVVKVEKVGDGISALGQSEVVKEQREAIAAAFGVPMHRLLSQGGRGSLEEEQAFFANVVNPRAKRQQATWNARVFAVRGIEFRFQFRRIEALQRAYLEMARAVQRLVEGPVMTQNEAREIVLSLPRVDDPRADELGDMDDQPAAQPTATNAGGDLSQEASTLAVQEATTDPERRRRGMPAEWATELDQWRRKVEKKGADVAFTVHALPPHVEIEVRQRLKLGESAEKAFEPPFIEY